jgi:putative hydrolase of HD superfamily
MTDDFTSWTRAFCRRESPEAIVARDADLLECMIQGKEYLDQGARHARWWFAKARDALQTKSARRLHSRLASWDSQRWWQDILGLNPGSKGASQDTR